MKEAATELGAEMKKQKDAANAKMADATAKDIGLRSEVKNDFLVATRMMKSFFLARNKSEVESLILRPAEVMPKYQEWTQSIPVQAPEQFQIAPKFITTDRFILLGVTMADGSTRMAAFEKLGKSSLRLDWESFAGWCECRFDAVAKLKSNRQVLMRVSAQLTAAKPPFSVTEGGQSFTLMHPDEPMTLNAHMPAELMAKDANMVHHMSGMQKRGMVTLKIFVDDECRSHGWVKIADVTNIGWVSGLDTAGSSVILSK